MRSSENSTQFRSAYLTTALEYAAQPPFVLGRMLDVGPPPDPAWSHLPVVALGADFPAQPADVAPPPPPAGAVPLPSDAVLLERAEPQRCLGRSKVWWRLFCPLSAVFVPHVVVEPQSDELARQQLVPGPGVAVESQPDALARLAAGLPSRPPPNPSFSLFDRGSG